MANTTNSPSVNNAYLSTNSVNILIASSSNTSSIIIDTDKLADKLGYVTSEQIYDSRNNFHPQGLFSELIFGARGTYRRRTSIGLIDLKVRLVHPEIYRIFKRLYKPLINLIHQTDTYYFAPQLNPDDPLIPIHDYEKYNIEKDDLDKCPRGTGLSFLLSIWDDLNNIPNIDPIKNASRHQLWHSVKKLSPTQIFLRYLIVIPPAFRPITITSTYTHIDETNDLYIRLIKHSKSIPSGSESSSDNIISQNVLDSIISRMQVTLNDLFERIKLVFSKKQGLIRQDLLGKRTDFSARAVVVPGPELGPQEAGIPFKIAVKIYQPFILHYLLYEYPNKSDKNKEELERYIDITNKQVREFQKSARVRYSLTTAGLSMLLDDISKGFINKRYGIYNFLLQILTPYLHQYPVILKRDPALHRENLQAYYPVIIDSDAIQLNPYYTKSFNCDHDGDTMACYVPLTKEAQQEAIEKMMPVKASCGYNKQLLFLTNDIITGLYVLTK